MTKASVIQPDVGIDRLAKPGDAVRRGTVLGRIHASNGAQAELAVARLQSAFSITPTPPVAAPLIVDTL